MGRAPVDLPEPPLAADALSQADSDHAPRVHSPISTVSLLATDNTDLLVFPALDQSSLAFMSELYEQIAQCPTLSDFQRKFPSVGCAGLESEDEDRTQSSPSSPTQLPPFPRSISEQPVISTAGEPERVYVDRGVDPLMKCKHPGCGQDVLGSVFHLHMKKHGDTRPFHCHMCARSFSRADHLRSHLRTHTGMRLILDHGCARLALRLPCSFLAPWHILQASARTRATSQPAAGGLRAQMSLTATMLFTRGSWSSCPCSRPSWPWQVRCVPVRDLPACHGPFFRSASFR
eukprot:m.306943 g.306943  ORF g.306943 m.306943 type:complete len:289 (+) comp55310_c0_seq3:307-1173(+)